MGAPRGLRAEEGQAPTLLSSCRGVCTRPATTRRPSRTSAPHWGTTPTCVPLGASCSGAGEAAWTTAVREAMWQGQQGPWGHAESGVTMKAQGLSPVSHPLGT